MYLYKLLFGRLTEFSNKWGYSVVFFTPVQGRRRFAPETTDSFNYRSHYYGGLIKTLPNSTCTETVERLFVEMECCFLFLCTAKPSFRALPDSTRSRSHATCTPKLQKLTLRNNSVASILRGFLFIWFVCGFVWIRHENSEYF